MKSKGVVDSGYISKAWGRLQDRFGEMLLPLLPPVLLVVFVVVVLMYALTPHGLIFYGDQTPVLNWNSLSYAQRFVWYQGQVSTGYNSFTYTLPALLFFNACGTDCTPKAMLILLAAGPGVSAYISFWILDRSVLPLAPEPAVSRRLTPVLFGIASAVYGFTFINEGFAAPLTYGVSFVELILPMLFAVSLAYITTGRPSYLLAAAIMVTFLSAAPEWVLFYLVLVVPLVIFLLYKQRSRLLRVFILAAGIAGSSSFVIIPIVESTFHFSGGIYSSYLLASSATPSLFSSNSWYSLADSIAVQQPALPIFHYFPATGTALNFLVPIAAFGALLSYRRRILAPIGVSALLCVVLATGANPPFGSLYVYIAERAGIFAVLLRNINLWFIPLTFAYALLILVFMSTFRLPHCAGSSRGIGFGKPRVSRKSALHNRVYVKRPGGEDFAVGIALGLTAAIILASGTLTVVGTVRPYYTPHTIPAGYGQLNQWLTSRGSNYGVIYYPTGGSYTWRNLSNDGQTDFPATISPEIPLDPTLAVSLLPFTRSIGLFMSTIGAQVFVIHNDTTTNVTGTYDELLNQTDLQLAWGDAYIAAFVNLVPAPSFRAVSQVDLVLGGVNYLPLVTPPLAPNPLQTGLYFSGGMPGLAGVFSGIPTTFVAPPSGDLEALSPFASAATLEETAINSTQAAVATLSSLHSFHGTIALAVSPSMAYGYDELSSIPGPFVTFSKRIYQVTVGSPNVNNAVVISNTSFLSGQHPLYSLEPNYSTPILVNASLPSGVCNSTGTGFATDTSPTFILFRGNNGSISNRLVQVSKGFEWMSTGPCEGVISFGLPTPQTAFGEMSLVGYYYNTQTYDTISAVGFVADAVTTGAWNSTTSPLNSTLTESSQTVTERLLVPASGNYTLSLAAVPLVPYLNATPALTLSRISGPASGCHGAPGVRCSLSSGWYNFSINDSGVLQIGDSYLQQVSANSSPQALVRPVVQAQFDSPVQWQVSVTASAPSLLYFAQQFDSAWRVEGTPSASGSLPLDGYGNGFALMDSGTQNFTIIEVDQSYLEAGSLLSIGSISLIAIFTVVPSCISRIRSRRRKGER